MSGCKIGKVKLKSGGKLHVLPVEKTNAELYDMGWGSITFRMHDGEPITRESMVYMLRVVEQMILEGD